MALTVVVRSGDVSAAPHMTFDAPRIVIGRGEGCEVRLPDASVSHRHASIRQRGTEYIVLDEGSINGTFVGPVRLSPQAPRVLRSGDLIRVGRIWLEIRIEQALPTPNLQQATKEIALALVAAALAAEGRSAGARVFVAEGPDAGRELLITEFEHVYVLGRGSEVALTLDDADASRRHVEIVRRGDQLSVRDLGTKNGTRLAGQKLEPKKEAVWPRGVALEIGKDRLLYDDPVAEAFDDLERAADERMQDDESIDPPAGAESPATAEAIEPLAASGPQAAAPIAEPPRRAARTERTVGFSITDLVIALVALAVLVSSLVGLFWLFRGE